MALTALLITIYYLLILQCKSLSCDMYIVWIEIHKESNEDKILIKKTKNLVVSIFFSKANLNNLIFHIHHWCLLHIVWIFFLVHWWISHKNCQYPWYLYQTFTKNINGCDQFMFNSLMENVFIFSLINNTNI